MYGLRIIRDKHHSRILLTTSEKEICIFTDSQAALLLLWRCKPTESYFRTIQVFQLLQKL